MFCVFLVVCMQGGYTKRRHSLRPWSFWLFGSMAYDPMRVKPHIRNEPSNTGQK